ncbi:MAG: hypothetical protein D6820_13955 [Lentisphaerae bacterium]|nr:MAG: hypothetical protein D6820_13955 [Lentisphaerota bacterium]
MSSIVRHIVCSVSLLFMGTLLAENPVAVRLRVDLGHPNVPAKLKNVRIEKGLNANSYNASWMKEKKDRLLCYEFDATDEWQEAVFTFVSDRDAVIPMVVKGRWYRPKNAKDILPLRVLVDNIQVEGSVLNNGDFEELNDKGFPNSWDLWAKDDKQRKEMVTPKSEGEAQSGTVFLRVWHNNAAVQRIEVQKDIPVRIHVWYKRAKLQPKEAQAPAKKK